MKLWFYWLFLITATVMMAGLNIKSLQLLIMLFTIVKLLTVSEVFMELHHAPLLWRNAMLLYSVAVPLVCFLIITV
ncbi:hypothetical protein [Methylophaga sp. OBS4]|uniref:hypothetical protein n=1 Tax=Methylophaga sp. OBS4 TaxID=2991935 RepID=UPI0022534B57|nr:hypothetical protein [Methylophaga sp. OBS4]MCX4186998.1 hypothetical protein [Methylophaga sp. OBS4]